MGYLQNMNMSLSAVAQFPIPLSLASYFARSPIEPLTDLTDGQENDPP